MIKISICLSDIPKDKMKQAQNGKWYLDLNIVERNEPDKYGNTLTGYIDQSKEERAEKRPKTYIASGKEVKFDSAPFGMEQPDFTPNN